MDNSLIKRQDAIDEVVAWLKDRMTDRKNGKPLTDRLKDLPSAQPLVLHCTDCEDWHTKQGVWGISVSELPSAQPEQHEIGYSECANAMLKMWIDNVLTDGEYSRIMDKLNAHWAERREE